ncbi:hypothetical protein MPH_09642 [Macrophomina phaseolina MS6]|uniref:Uncharacterized protein n=1 Tax=Macrophomina phaseolina (strain MS6) TaxID=1126212 RepID=K2S917_MACPH|nr:hypothetical protein MPH_09642 [Macrophomina phaseolina MS6]
MKQATVQPEIPAHLQANLRMNISKRRMENANQDLRKGLSLESDEFGDGGLGDSDLEGAIDTGGFVDIDKFSLSRPLVAPNDFQRPQQSTLKIGADGGYTKQTSGTQPEVDGCGKPKRLENGKWACNHKCKDKQACKHLCCKEGMDKAPSARRQAKTTGPDPGKSTQHGRKSPNNKRFITGQKTKTKLNPSRNGLDTGLGTLRKVERLDLTGTDSQPATQAHKGDEKLRAEAKRALLETTPVSLEISNKRTRHSYESGQPSRLSLLQSEKEEQAANSPITSDDDYSGPIEDMATTQPYSNMNSSSYPHQNDDEFMFYGDGDLFADMMAGVAFLDQNPDPHTAKRRSLHPQDPVKAPKTALPKDPAPRKQKTPSLAHSRSWSPEHPPAPLRPVQERSNTTTPTPSSAGRDSVISHRIPRKPLRGLDTASVRSESTSSSRLRVMNPDPDPLSPEEPSPKALPPGLEDVDPWLIQEFAAYVNFT